MIKYLEMRSSGLSGFDQGNHKGPTVKKGVRVREGNVSGETELRK